MPIKQRPHLAWIVRLVPLVSSLIVLAFFLLYPPTAASTRANIAKWWSGESAPTYNAMTNIFPTCGSLFSICTPAREIAAEPRARAIVERHVPGFWINPTAVELQRYELRLALTRLEVPPAVQRRIDSDLSFVSNVEAQSRFRPRNAQ